MDNINVSSTSSNSDNSFWNVVIVLIIILVVFYFLIKKSENFSKLTNMSFKLSNIPNELNTEISSIPSSYTNGGILVNNTMNMDLLNSNELTTNVRSVNHLNTNKNTNSENVNCNLLGVDSNNMNAFKKKYYKMYSHQIDCPKNCNLDEKGNKCYSRHNDEKSCENINALNSISDVTALNYLAIDNNNKKPCVTCNFKPIKNPLNREYLETYNNLSEDVRLADEARLHKQQITNANVSNYVNFENNVNLNSIGETQVDKINEMRSCPDSGVCNLSSFGNTIANSYDKLLSTPAYSLRNSINSNVLEGILDDSAKTDNYASVY